VRSLTDARGDELDDPHERLEPLFGQCVQESSAFELLRIQPRHISEQVARQRAAWSVLVTARPPDAARPAVSAGGIADFIPFSQFDISRIA
jgi:hypothetical protein